MLMKASGLTPDIARHEHAAERRFVEDTLNSFCRELKGTGNTVRVLGYLSEFLTRICAREIEVLSLELSKNMFVDPALQVTVDQFWSTILMPALAMCYTEPDGLDEARVLRVFHHMKEEMGYVIRAEFNQP